VTLAHRAWGGLVYPLLTLNLIQRILWTPHQPLQIRIFCHVGGAGFFLNFSLCATRFFIFLLELLNPLAVAFS
jgi:hypothetical protein